MMTMKKKKKRMLMMLMMLMLEKSHHLQKYSSNREIDIIIPPFQNDGTPLLSRTREDVNTTNAK